MPCEGQAGCGANSRKSFASSRERPGGKYGTVRIVNGRIPKTSFLHPDFTPLAENPLVASVLRENVQFSGNRATINLWPNWPGLLTELPTFGRLLSICRNPYAVLGSMGEYRKTLFASCGHCAFASDGSAEYYFSCWAHARAVAEKRDDGWLYAVEFMDACGDTLHKVCLTAESDFDAFRAWVELHQYTSTGIPARGRGVCGTNPCATPLEEAIFLRPEIVPSLIREMIERDITGHFVVGNDGMVQGANILPASLREEGQWIFFSDAHTGMHLRNERLAEICLQQLRRPDGAIGWILKAFESESRLVCAITPPRGCDIASWDEFLLTTTEPFHIHES